MNRSISIETLLIALSALDGATKALSEAPGERAFSTYLDTMQAGAKLRASLGLLEPVQIAEMKPAETKTASPLRLAA